MLDHPAPVNSCGPRGIYQASLGMHPGTTPPRTVAAARLPTILRRGPKLIPLTIFLIGHIVLAFTFRQVPVLATMHAAACLVVGLVIGARGRMHQVAYMTAYITGAEVLWRMTHANVVWEFGKYAVSAVLLIALVRIRPRKNLGIALGYFLLLLPSTALTLLAFDLDLARQYISFNLSGPLALMLCVLFFSNVRLTMEQVHASFLTLMGPVIGIAAVAYFTTAEAETIAFTGQSNAVTSGGFGPNQVSAMLGAGLLFAFLMLLERSQQARMKVPLLVIAVVLATQSALTFSRGGLVMAFASAFFAMFYLVRDRRTRVTLVVLGTLLFAVGNYVVVPRLETFTQGKLKERYLSTKTSNRNMLAMNDIQIFFDNPALGVGPGVAGAIRSDFGVSVAAHTEFTRMLSEHGVLGGLAMVILGLLGARTIKSTRGAKHRAYVIAMLCWFTLFLLVNAMRIVAPAFMFGLACAVAYSSQQRAKPPRKAVPVLASGAAA